MSGPAAWPCGGGDETLGCMAALPGPRALEPRFRVERAGEAGASLVAGSDFIAVGHPHRGVSAWDASGHARWTRPDLSVTPGAWSLATDGVTVLVLSTSALLGLDASSGQTLFSQSLPGTADQGAGTRPMLAGEGSRFSLVCRGELHRVDLRSGTLALQVLPAIGGGPPASRGEVTFVGVVDRGRPRLAMFSAEHADRPILRLSRQPWGRGPLGRLVVTATCVYLVAHAAGVSGAALVAASHDMDELWTQPLDGELLGATHEGDALVAVAGQTRQLSAAMGEARWSVPVRARHVVSDRSGHGVLATADALVLYGPQQSSPLVQRAAQVERMIIGPEARLVTLEADGALVAYG